VKSPPPPVETVDPDVEAAVEGHPSFAAWRLMALIAAIIGLGLWQGWALVVVILSILTMIFLHELGHFVMARRAGMKVTEFFIGFGPRIWSFRRGEVEYGIKGIPAGAYVRIIGMSDIDEVEPGDESRTYRRKTYAQRIGVAVAGSTMHFLLALVLMLVVFAGFGVTSQERWVSSDPSPGSAAALGGIRKGDKVVSVDGVEVSTHDEMATEARRRPDQTVPIGIIRDGRRITTDVTLGSRAFVFGTVAEDLSLGALDGRITINSVPPKSAQSAAGLRDGDVLVSINGTPLTSLGQLKSITSAADTGRLRLGLHRDGAELATVLDLGAKVSATESTGFLGIGHELPRERLGVLAAAGRSATTFASQAGASVVGIGKLFNPVNLYHFAGNVMSGEKTSTTPTRALQASEQRVRSESARPLSIIGVVGVGEQLTADLATFLMFLAGINIVIGVINLIPLPPFDGGHVMIATYEKLREMIRRDGHRYLANTNKILPVAYGVLLVMVTVGVLAGYADITQPLRI